MKQTSPLILLHLGLGAFHRAHQAACLQTLHDAGDTRWSFVSTNIRPDPLDPAMALGRNAGAYTLETVTPDGSRHYRRITAIAQALPYAPSLAAALAIGARADTRIVSFTVTEAGYFLDADGQLDIKHPDLVTGLAQARAGQPGTTIYGVLTAILRARRDSGAGPVTLLCCDNLRHNGTRVQHGFMQFLAMLEQSELRTWVEANTSFPNSMVDRITPRPPPELRARVLAAMGQDDAGAVTSESFFQWVIEDRFCNGRPAFENAGAEMVAAVAPYEEAKIRILNASHSGIAWAGLLAGYTYIHEGVRDARIRALVHAYITDAVFDCLRPSPVDLVRYRDTVLERFAGDAIRDTNARVLADSFAKLPGFIVPTIRECLQQKRPLDSVAVLPALFLRFLQRWQAGAIDVDYQDQAMTPSVVRDIVTADDPVAAFCAQRMLWDELAGHPVLVAAIRSAARAIDAL